MSLSTVIAWGQVVLAILALVMIAATVVVARLDDDPPGDDPLR